MFLGRGIRRPSKYLKAPSFKNQTDFGSLWMNCLRVNGPQQKYGVGGNYENSKQRWPQCHTFAVMRRSKGIGALL